METEEKAKQVTFTRPIRAKRLTRVEKAQATYNKLIDAAAHVVGEEGYAATSIVRITARAGVSQGTFYNYFKDRQSLFDTLLPAMGQQLTDQIGEEVQGIGSGVEREIERFRSFCGYLQENPGFYRILYEAEVFSPKAHKEHIQRLSEGYYRALERHMEDGFCADLSKDELKAVVVMMLGIRAYVAMCYIKDGTVPDHVIDAYSKLIRVGLTPSK